MKNCHLTASGWGWNHKNKRCAFLLIALESRKGWQVASFDPFKRRPPSHSKLMVRMQICSRFQWKCVHFDNNIPSSWNRPRGGTRWNLFRMEPMQNRWRHTAEGGNQLDRQLMISIFLSTVKEQVGDDVVGRISSFRASAKSGTHSSSSKNERQRIPPDPIFRNRCSSV